MPEVTHPHPHAGGGLKHKVGPLPLWSWIVIVGGAIGIYLLIHKSSSSSSTANSNTVDPSSPTGLTYGQEAQDAALGIDPTTGQSFAQEQAANSGGGGSSGDTGASSGDAAALGQIDSDINTLSSAIANQPVVDNTTPAQTFGGEVTDVLGGISALQAAGLVGAATPATATKSSASLPKLTATGAIRLTSGPTKPAAPKGMTVIGLGSGNWEAVPTIATKTVHTTAPAAPSKPKTPAKPTTVSGKKGATLTINKPK